jgi:hypothetical protein
MDIMKRIEEACRPPNRVADDMQRAVIDGLTNRALEEMDRVSNMVKSFAGSAEEAAKMPQTIMGYQDALDVSRHFRERVDITIVSIEKQRKLIDSFIGRLPDGVAGGLLDRRPAWLERFIPDVNEAARLAADPIGQPMGIAQRALGSIMPTPVVPSAVDLIMKQTSPYLKREFGGVTGDLGQSLVSERLADLFGPVSRAHADLMGRMRDAGVLTVGGMMAGSAVMSVAEEMRTALDVVALGRQFGFNTADILGVGLFHDAAVAIDDVLAREAVLGDNVLAGNPEVSRVKDAIIVHLQSKGSTRKEPRHS